MNIKYSLAVTALAIALAAPNAIAQVYKCVGASGKVNFSDKPCDNDQKSGEVKMYAEPAAISPVTSQPSTMSAEAKAHESKRREKRTQSNESHKRIDAEAAKITKMRTDNADPAKCKEARVKMAIMEKREPLTYKLDVAYFQFEMAANLYCGN